MVAPATDLARCVLAHRAGVDGVQASWRRYIALGDPPLAAEAGPQAVAHRRPLLGEHAEQHGVADGAVGPALVAAQRALVARPQPGYRLLRARVADVGLQLDPSRAE